MSFCTSKVPVRLYLQDKQVFERRVNICWLKVAFDYCSSMLLAFEHVKLQDLYQSRSWLCKYNTIVLN